MREISLKKEYSTPTKVSFGVFDPEGRKRCTLELDFSSYDLKELQADGLSAEEAFSSYEKELRDMISGLIGPAWKCTAGWDEVLAPVKDALGARWPAEKN